MMFRVPRSDSNPSLAISKKPAARIVYVLVAGFCAIMLSCVLIAQESDSDAAVSPINRPFPDGERLVFNVEWDPPWYFFFLPKMKAGEVELQFTAGTRHKGQQVATISFKARSSGVLVKLARFTIDDEFIFLSDPETFCTFNVSKKIREGKRKRHLYVAHLRETRQLYVREMDESVVPPKLKKEEVKNNIPACIRDPFSAIYYLRTSQLRENHVLTSSILDNGKIKEIRAHVEKKEDIKTPLGRFAAWKVNSIAVMGGLFKGGGEFRFWLSADERKVPLQFEAKMNLGRALGKLKLMEN